MNKILKLTASFLASLLITQVGFASAFNCVGKLSAVKQSPKWGTVTISINGSFSNAMICNVNREYRGVSPEICKEILRTANAALVSGQMVMPTFEKTAAVKRCQELPQWANGNVEDVKLRAFTLIH